MWRVHLDFPGMLAGGLAALTLQTRHPLALAGVQDHSSFRDDLVGQRRRTTVFVGATTDASLANGEMLIRHMREIHRHVRGVPVRVKDGIASRACRRMDVSPAVLTHWPVHT